MGRLTPIIYPPNGYIFVLGTSMYFWYFGEKMVVLHITPHKGVCNIFGFGPGIFKNIIPEPRIFFVFGTLPRTKVSAFLSIFQRKAINTLNIIKVTALFARIAQGFAGRQMRGMG